MYHVEYIHTYVGLDLYVDAISAEISVIVWTKGPWKWCKGVGGLWFLY